MYGPKAQPSTAARANPVSRNFRACGHDQHTIMQVPQLLYVFAWGAQAWPGMHAIPYGLYYQDRRALCAAHAQCALTTNSGWWLEIARVVCCCLGLVGVWLLCMLKKQRTCQLYQRTRQGSGSWWPGMPRWLDMFAAPTHKQALK